MSSIMRVNIHVLVLVIVFIGQGASAALLPEEVAGVIATRLDQEQSKEGLDLGQWASEPPFTGPIAAGVAGVYEWTGDPVYRACAELGGYHIVSMGASVGNLWGDDAYTLVRLSEISDDREENIWRTVLEEFFESPRLEPGEGTTEDYIALFDQIEPSTLVYYVAHYAIAAHYVDDPDKGIWRDALIRDLSHVDDDSAFPVMALGIATWSLAATGPLDTTPIVQDDDEEASLYWADVTLSDLPALLLCHQVPEGELFAGSFYWRFDHGTGVPEGGIAAGYTEDTVFGTLGLVNAALYDSNSPAEEMNLAIDTAQESLLGGIDEEGYVYTHLSCQGPAYNLFAGEMLQSLWSIEHYYQWRESDANDVENDANNVQEEDIVSEP